MQRPTIRRVCVFCGSKAGTDPIHATLAGALGEEFANRGLELVFGGGKVGLMGILADSVLARGGRAVGVIPDPLMIKELAHTGLTELRVVPSMHARKALMAELSDGFVALPGGFGTLEELLETITWAQLGLHRKPIGLLNIAGFFDPLLAMFEHAVHAGFLRRKYLDLFFAAPEPGQLVDQLQNYRSELELPQWIDESEA